MDAIEEVVDGVLPWLWRLTGRGFLTTDGGVPVWVAGIDDPDIAAHQIEFIVAACLAPERRRVIDSEATFAGVVLDEQRVELRAFARRAGTLVDVASEEARREVPDEVEDIDALLTSGQAPSDAALTPDVERAQQAEALRAIKDAYVAGLDERSRQLVHERFVLGRTRAEVAGTFDCGVAAVTERELRVRRKLGHAVRRAHEHLDLGPAALDGLLSDRLLDPAVHPVTRERVRTDICRRIHIDTPRSFGARAVWAVGVSAVAFAAWLLMFLGVLPNPGDDVYPTPAVSAACKAPCAQGSDVTFEVTAPQDATDVAIAFVGADGVAKPLLFGPSGATISVPFGARVRAVPIPYLAPAPAASGTVLAVFSQRRLNEAEILGVANRTEAIEGTLTATTALGSRG